MFHWTVNLHNFQSSYRSTTIHDLTHQLVIILAIKTQRLEGSSGLSMLASQLSMLDLAH